MTKRHKHRLLLNGEAPLVRNSTLCSWVSSPSIHLLSVRRMHASVWELNSERGLALAAKTIKLQLLQEPVCRDYAEGLLHAQRRHAHTAIHFKFYMHAHADRCKSTVNAHSRIHNHWTKEVGTRKFMLMRAQRSRSFVRKLTPAPSLAADGLRIIMMYFRHSHTDRKSPRDSSSVHAT